MEPKLTDLQFRTMLDWFMVSDPWSLSEKAHDVMYAFLDSESKARGFEGWVIAFHEFKSEMT